MTMSSAPKIPSTAQNALFNPIGSPSRSLQVEQPASSDGGQSRQPRLGSIAPDANTDDFMADQNHPTAKAD